jgi:hypothetical protein
VAFRRGDLRDIARRAMSERGLLPDFSPAVMAQVGFVRSTALRGTSRLPHAPVARHRASPREHRACFDVLSTPRAGRPSTVAQDDRELVEWSRERKTAASSVT